MDISPIRVVRAQCCAGNPQLRWCARNGRHILQQRCQGGEHRNVNIGSGANTPGRAGRPIEHPGRNLQPSPGCPTREAATENLSASLFNHLMNMDQASGPRMPRIKKLVLRDPWAFNGVRTHRSLNKDAPVSRPVQWIAVINSRSTSSPIRSRLAFRYTQPVRQFMIRPREESVIVNGKGFLTYSFNA